MAKKKPLPKSLAKHQIQPALSGLGIGGMVKLVLLAVFAIGGAIIAIRIHYHPSGMFLAPDAAASTAPAPTTSSSDGIEYIDIDMDASVLP